MQSKKRRVSGLAILSTTVVVSMTLGTTLAFAKSSSSASAHALPIQGETPANNATDVKPTSPITISIDATAPTFKQFHEQFVKNQFSVLINNQSAQASYDSSTNTITVQHSTLTRYTNYTITLLLKAAANGNTTSGNASFSFHFETGSAIGEATHVTASVANPSVSVDTGGTLKVHATDDYGDPATNATVSVTGTGHFIKPSNMTITSGIASVPLNDHKAESDTVTYTVKDNTYSDHADDTNTGTVNEVFVPGAPASLTLTPANASVPAGTADTLTGDVYDQYGNFVTNDNGTVSISVNGGVPVAVGVKKGIFTYNLDSTADQTAGIYNITAVDGKAKGAARVIVTPGTGNAFTTTLASQTVDSTATTISAQLPDGGTAQLSIPEGAFPTSETVSIVSGSASDMTKYLPQGATNPLTFGVHFSGVAPKIPVTLTITNPAIKTGEQVFKVRPDGSLTVVPFSATSGQVVLKFTSDPNFVISQMKDSIHIPTGAIDSLLASDLSYQNYSNTDKGNTVQDFINNLQIDTSLDPNANNTGTGPSHSDYEFQYLKDWQLVDLQNNTGLFGDGFYAIALKKGNTIIVAFRGTDNLQDYGYDLFGIGLNTVQSQRRDARSFLERVNQEYPNSQFILTGHSLGGWIVQRLVLDISQGLVDGGNFHLSSVEHAYTFNGPGFFNPGSSLMTAVDPTMIQLTPAEYTRNKNGGFSMVTNYSISADWVTDSPSMTDASLDELRLKMQSAPFYGQVPYTDVIHIGTNEKLPYDGWYGYTPGISEPTHKLGNFWDDASFQNTWGVSTANSTLAGNQQGDSVTYTLSLENASGSPLTGLAGYIEPQSSSASVTFSSVTESASNPGVYTFTASGVSGTNPSVSAKVLVGEKFVDVISGPITTTGGSTQTSTGSGSTPTGTSSTPDGYAMSGYDSNAIQPTLYSWSGISKYSTNITTPTVNPLQSSGGTSPVIGGDGTLYYLSGNGLDAVSPDGTLKWSDAGSSEDDVVIGQNNTLYDTSTNTLTAINASTGSVVWSFNNWGETGLGAGAYHLSPPVIGSSGNIYVEYSDFFDAKYELAAISPSGKLLWTVPFTSGPSSVVVGKHGDLYTIESGVLMAINESSGQVDWSWTIPREFGIGGGSPVLDSDGNIYVVGYSGGNYDDLYEVSPSGVQINKWGNMPVGGGFLVAKDGSIYAQDWLWSTSTWNLLKIVDGTVVWRHSFDDLSEGGSLVSGSDGTLYLQRLGSMYAFRPDGSLKWELNNENFSGEPVVGNNNSIYVGGNHLYVVNQGQ